MGFGVVGQGLDAGARLLDGVEGRGVELDPGTVAGDRDDVGDADRTGGDEDVLHVPHSAAREPSRQRRRGGGVQDAGHSRHGHVPGAPTVGAALRILSFMAAQQGPVAAATLARALDLPRSSVYRLLGELADQGFVLHFPEARRYGLGIAAFELSSGTSGRNP